jgi:hypothetical protein
MTQAQEYEASRKDQADFFAALESMADDGLINEGHDWEREVQVWIFKDGSRIETARSNKSEMEQVGLA